jgi:hypothetical protein
MQGCEQVSQDASVTTVEDSAGVRLVTSAEPASGLDRWSVTDSPTLTIGVPDGDPEYQFFQIGGVVRLSTGQIIVGNTGTNELRFYSPDGVHQVSVGGPGAGPGEYGYLRFVWLLKGDSILVEDAINSRLNLYGADATLVRGWPMSELGAYVTPPPVGRFDDGRWLVRTARTIGQPPEPVEFVGLLVAYESDSAPDTLAEVPGGPAYWEQVDNFVRRLPAPFATTTHVVMTGDRIFAGNGATFEVRVLDSHGPLNELWRLTAPERRVTASDIAADKAGLLARARTDNQRRDIERVYGTVPVPDLMPAYSRLLVDAAGLLWVEEYFAAGDQVRSHVIFSPDGRPVARVRLPRQFEMRQIGQDYIIGIWLDDATGVEYVRQFGLDRGEDPSISLHGYAR